MLIAIQLPSSHINNLVPVEFVQIIQCNFASAFKNIRFYVLFIKFTNDFFSKNNFKIEYYSIIYIFKNYFVNIFVGTRFVADRNSGGFAREKALTISFVERGFERLGLDRQAVGFSWRSYKVK